MIGQLRGRCVAAVLADKTTCCVCTAVPRQRHKDSLTATGERLEEHIKQYVPMSETVGV